MRGVVAVSHKSEELYWTFPPPFSGALFYAIMPNAKECAMNARGTYVVQKLIEKALQSEVGMGMQSEVGMGM